MPPLAEAGFRGTDGSPDQELLLQYGPTLAVTVSHYVSDAAPALQPPNEPVSTHALVDTGATQSCIDIGLARELELPVIDTVQLSGSDGTKTHPVFLAAVSIPSLEFYQYGSFAGVALAEGGQQHRALLGRTFLQNVIMIYDGIRAQVTLASMRHG